MKNLKGFNSLWAMMSHDSTGEVPTINKYKFKLFFLNIKNGSNCFIPGGIIVYRFGEIEMKMMSACFYVN